MNPVPLTVRTLIAEWLYKPRTIKDIKDAFYDAQNTLVSSVRRIRLDYNTVESGSAVAFRDEIVSSQEQEIADLFRALAAARGKHISGPSTVDVSSTVQSAQRSLCSKKTRLERQWCIRIAVKYFEYQLRLY